MNFVENNGKKVAAVLCLASCLPVVATVYAMETEPGWHGDKYINEDQTVAKGWQEIEGKSYYFSEDDGTVEADTTREAVVASVSTTISEDVQETVAALSDEVVTEQLETLKTDVVEETEEIPGEEVEADEPVIEELPPVEDVEEPEETTPPVEELPEVTEPSEEEVEEPAEEELPPVEDVEEPAEDEIVDTPADDETTDNAGETEEVTPPADDVEEPVEDEIVDTPVVDDVVADTPVVDDVVADTPVEDDVVDTPVETTPDTSTSTGGTYDSINAAIVDAAYAVYNENYTNGWWCTDVATEVLNRAGVSAGVVWPDEYVQYGYITSDPQPGNLIYYDVGGRGVDHIAVYLGDGLALHGMYTGGVTTIASATLNSANATYYIQVTG